MQSTNNNRKDNNNEYDIRVVFNAEYPSGIVMRGEDEFDFVVVSEQDIRVEGKKLTDTAFDSIVEMLKKVFYPEQIWNHAQPVIDA